VDQEQQSRWQPIRRQLLWAGGIAALAFLIIVICGYLFGWKWTGLPKRTLWDWLQLLIIPAVLAGGVAWFNQQQQRQQDKRDQDQREHDALQAYLDQIGTLLLQQKLRIADDTDDARNLARARTLTVLDMLSPPRKPRALEFLFEMGLIQTIPSDREPIISLRFAILREAPLANRHLLKSADLDRATLDRADLTNANLSNTKLPKARLIGTNLTAAKLINANLTQARLIGTNLTRADLWGADLSGADLSNAVLTDADLTDADLTGAFKRNKDASKQLITAAELKQRAKSLLGATMPNGQKYVD
jgi:Pentapeptide repeats (8 copies)